MRFITFFEARTMRSIIAGLIALGVCTSLAAQAAPARWEFTIAPYALFPTMQGSTALGNLPPVNVDASANDIYSHLQGGFMLYFQARKGDWAFATDAIYMNLGQDLHQDANWVTGNLTMKQSAWEGYLFWRFVPTLEVGPGFLGNRVQAGIAATIAPPDTTVSRGLTKEWWLPMLGMRWTPINSTHWHGVVFANFGGTGGDNWSWQVMPSVGFKFTNWFELALQYRYIAIDYQNGMGAENFAYRMNIFGPQVGLIFHF